MKKTKLLNCIICGIGLTPNDMDFEWCNNCLRKHLEKTDPHYKPSNDNKKDIKPEENGKRNN